ncbi:MAG: ornithine carbamoyltransferase [Pseudonocardiaceae bacterium]
MQSALWDFSVSSTGQKWRRPKRRHLISLINLSDEEIWLIVQRGLGYSTGEIRPDGQLNDCVLGTFFTKTSTRTRTAFTSGALRLGARVIAYGPNDLQLNTGETLHDTGRVLSGMLDIFVARTASDPAELAVLAAQDKMAVVNAMTADEHPTQALADLTTILQRLGRVEGVTVLYLGEGNNTAAALALTLPRFPGNALYFRTPPGYGLKNLFIERGAAWASASGGVLDERHDLNRLPEHVDVVYTTRWQTTGTEKKDARWREVFDPFRVDSALMTRYPDAIFMHDLPAHRGEEVAASVLDGEASIVFDQAENKLHSAMAVLEWCAGCEY